MKKSSLAIAALLTVLSTTQLSVAFAEDGSTAAPAQGTDNNSTPATDAPTDDKTAPADGEDTGS